MNINKDKARLVSMFINKKDFENFKEKAKKIGISQSAFLRELVLNTNYIENRELFKEFLDTNKLLLDNMQRIGNNINQIAYHLNMNISQSDEEILVTMQSLRNLLNEYKDFVMNSKYPKLFKKRKFKGNSNE